MKKAYVTMLCHGDGYVPGAEVLAKSLDASGSTIPRVAMVTADISLSARASLERRGWETRLVAPIANPTPDALLVFSRFAPVFTKLRAWELVDFDRVVLLDADTLVIKNVDDLFDRPVFAAAPDFFLPDRFNSGVMVIPPSLETFAKMVDALTVAPSYDGGDQGFLNSFFADWYAMPAVHRLPVGYNLASFIFQFAHGHPSLQATLAREAKILHYMVQKPWQAKSTLTGGSEAWWNMYFDAHPEKARVWRHRVHAIEDWTFDRLAALVSIEPFPRDRSLVMKNSHALVWALFVGSVATVTTLAAAANVRAPLICSRGPSGQHFDAVITLPRTAPEGSTYTIRIDGLDFGKIEHTGLNYIHDMSTEYVLPSGTTYVPGSARIVPNTGTANVAAGARVRHEGTILRVMLPGRVESGSHYTPPSIEFQVKVASPAGASLALKLHEYRVTANAFLVGDLLTTCEPTPKPFTLATTLVTAAAP